MGLAVQSHLRLNRSSFPLLQNRSVQFAPRYLAFPFRSQVFQSYSQSRVSGNKPFLGPIYQVCLPCSGFSLLCYGSWCQSVFPFRGIFKRGAYLKGSQLQVLCVSLRYTHTFFDHFSSQACLFPFFDSTVSKRAFIRYPIGELVVSPFSYVPIFTFSVIFAPFFSVKFARQGKAVFVASTTLN